MKPTLIGWYLLLLVGMAAAMLMCSGCCHKTYESIVRDSVTTEHIDSVIVNMREVEVEIPVPQITLQEKIPLCDTLLILDNGYYQSIVDIHNGQITHTLKPSENADGMVPTIPATVVVADTTHISNTNTNSTHTEKEKEVVKEKETWWDGFKRKVGGYALVLLLIVMLAFGAKLLWRTKISP